MSLSAHEVAGDEAGLRLDRWFRRHFPAMSHGRLQRLLRTGQVRVDGHRVKSGYRLAVGQQVRVPPEAVEAGSAAAPQTIPGDPAVGDRDRRDLEGRILHIDDEILILNKPPGLAVQGGSAVSRHLDGMLDALKLGLAERPKLVHRLDKDTSGVLVLARTMKAAAALSKSFRDGRVRKVYWAIVVGVPEPRQGRIDLALAKRAGPGGERVRADPEAGRRAVTDYAVIDRAGREACWLALRPITGRTHQIRAHAAAIDRPILGDGKYGRRQAFLKTLGISERLHLHAHDVRLPTPNGGVISTSAPLPAHFTQTMSALGFSAGDYLDPFED